MQALRDAEKRSSTPPPPSTPLEAHLKLRFETLGRAASARPDEVCKRSLFQALGSVAADIHGQALRDSEKLQAWRWLDHDEAGCVSWEKFYRRAAALHRRLLATGNITSAIAALGEVLQVGLHASAEVRAHDAAVAAAVRASAPPTTAAPPAAAPAAAPAGASGELGEKLRASFAELATPDASGKELFVCKARLFGRLGEAGVASGAAKIEAWRYLDPLSSGTVRWEGYAKAGASLVKKVRGRRRRSPSTLSRRWSPARRPPAAEQREFRGGGWDVAAVGAARPHARLCRRRDR